MANELNSEHELNGPIEANSTSPGSSPDLSVESSGRQRNAKGHKPDCSCTLCRRIQARIAAGKPPIVQLTIEQKIARATRRKQQKQSNPTRTKIQTAIETQIALGHKPNAQLTAKIAGVRPETVSRNGGVGGSSEFVQGALKNAGIDDTRLAEVAAAGLDAAAQRIVTDRDGNIVDVINVPDWKARHSFWSDLLRVKRILGGESESGGGSGGLIIITPDNAKVLPGHAPTCSCDGCLRAWEQKTEHLRRAAMRERALLDVGNSERQDSRQDPRAKNANAIDVDVIDEDAIDEEEPQDDEVETDDFGPIVG